MSQQRTKDLLERMTACLLLVGLSPILGCIAVAIRLDSTGPVLYRQRRVGLNGSLFTLLKFRTMMVGADRIGLRWEVSRDDARITAVGRVLRRLSLDELPQLVNVVRGEMALVGPRPALAHQVARYTPRQRLRLSVKPGLTGLAQVMGRNNLCWDERIELDILYVEHQSCWLDVKILLRTPMAMLRGTGIYGRDGVVREKV